MIEVRGLTQTFRTRTGPVDAVKGIDFEVRDGEILGLLGPNGAGKTTTLRMLCTLLKPTAGSAVVAGIGTVKFTGGEFTIGAGDTGPVTTRMREALVGIQKGQRDDPDCWVHVVAGA